jgi:hypothetical protein
MDTSVSHGQTNANANANVIGSQSIYGSQQPRLIGQNQNGISQNDSAFGDSKLDMPQTPNPSTPANPNFGLPEIGEKSKFFTSRNSEKISGVSPDKSPILKKQKTFGIGLLGLGPPTIKIGSCEQPDFDPESNFSPVKFQNPLDENTNSENSVEKMQVDRPDTPLRRPVGKG